MNIFILDSNLQRCAKAHCDKHVSKMILEYAQMLCTVVSNFSLPAAYKPTHRHHPCTLWAGESLENWLWLKDLAQALNQEYCYRYNRLVDHRSYTVITQLPTPPLPQKGLTEHAQAMPEEYRVPGNAVKAYRAFYRGTKAHFACWSKRPAPAWFKK
jgi:hypothetical protein